jgi:hypothetical protein
VKQSQIRSFETASKSLGENVVSEAVAALGPDDQFGKNALSGLGACPALAGSAEVIDSQERLS